MSRSPVHRRLRAGACLLLGSGVLLVASSAAATPIGGLVMTEVLFAPAGNDATREWIEIYNGTSATLDMADFSLGWGQDDVTTNTHVFASFALAPGETFVIGGPTSLANNGNPVYDEVFDFVPDLDDGDDPASAGTIGLFAGDAGSGGTLRHLFVYGQSTATTSILDEQGALASVMLVTDGFNQAASAEWQGGTSWIRQTNEAPGIPALPEPGSGLLLAAGLVGLALGGRRA